MKPSRIATGLLVIAAVFGLRELAFARNRPQQPTQPTPPDSPS